MPSQTAVDEYCSSVTCAINRLTEVIQADAGRDFYDWLTLVLQVLVGLATVILAWITIVLTSKFRAEDRRANEEMQKRADLEHRRAVSDVIYQVLEFLDNRDPNSAALEIRPRLQKAVNVVADPDEPGLSELLASVTRTWERSMVAYLRDEHIPWAWTQTTLNSDIRSWVRDPSAFAKRFKERKEVDELLEGVTDPN